ncbi:7,8-Dihydro-6-hydroxymethylpterin-pyrophosphokinase, HPPK [Syntrophomonas zehnderi OL-4]|uniref:2-amino-4-hydroxy-6-hydroxymethyldihydropteridine diphosphokinase n=1 Tax=Syntrophomonas zehnderi OL-4 TaxID=690567 RepID=A0A0E3W2N3_9FIRM|nr:2-amino-4-hydroxy-6-hydroxymethyldihydropteridine diphosphokinase [Syntrophomonas zehnderi]CFX10907.1 7,8-Dihydro-6-hydroxymethylpterin-pyrophosphokinase, HPPK [Syntrophomonas zehnderi OL-4]
MGKRAYLSLGTNLGNKYQNIVSAHAYIKQIAGVKISRQSSIYRTSPWGKTDQSDFLNQVIEIETELNPLDLLHELQSVEIKMGRLTNEKWGPRIIDLDIVLYGDENIHLKELTVPHPYIFQRLFVLIPLQEIEPDFIFPDGSSIKEVLARVPHQDGENKSIIKLEYA